MSPQIRAFAELRDTLPNGSYSSLLTEFFLHFCLPGERRDKRLSKYVLHHIFPQRDLFRFHWHPLLSAFTLLVFLRIKYWVIKRSEKREVLALLLTSCIWLKLSLLTFLNLYFLYCNIGIIIPVITGILGTQIKNVEKLWKHKGWLFFCVRERKRDLALLNIPQVPGTALSSLCIKSFNKVTPWSRHCAHWTVK